MLKEKIVVADVVKKYENPIGELVQVACQFSSNINLLSEEHYGDYGDQSAGGNGS